MDERIIENIAEMFGNEKISAISDDEMFALKLSATFNFCGKEDRRRIKTCLLEAIKWGKSVK